MLGTLEHRVRTAALDFASWGPSAGILLVLATEAAIAITNSPLGLEFEALWRQEPILHWINDGLRPRPPTQARVRAITPALPIPMAGGSSRTTSRQRRPRS